MCLFAQTESCSTTIIVSFPLRLCIFVSFMINGQSSNLHQPSQNHLLASFSLSAYQQLLPYFEECYLDKTSSLAWGVSQIARTYFPVDCIISIDHLLESGDVTEIALIGDEGMYDVTRVLGGVGMHYSSSIQTPGYAFVIEEQILKQVLTEDDSIQHILLLYAQALFTQMAQGAVCNRHHSLSQHLCLLLLLMNDKSHSSDFQLTQETIAHMLGVRREEVTRVAVKLRNNGLIDYRRGHILVKDRAGLESHCCECYQIVKNEFKRLLGY